MDKVMVTVVTCSFPLSSYHLLANGHRTLACHGGIVIRIHKLVGIVPVIVSEVRRVLTVRCVLAANSAQELIQSS